MSHRFTQTDTDTGQDHLDRINRIIRIFLWLLLFPEEKVASQSGFAGVKDWPSFPLRMRLKNIGEFARPKKPKRLSPPKADCVCPVSSGNWAMQQKYPVIMLILSNTFFCFQAYEQ
jgi:hypothetical protein